MRKPYVFYLPDGKLVGNAKHSSPLSAERSAASVGALALEGEGHPDTHYVDIPNLTIVPRPENPTSLANNWLENLPIPCTITLLSEGHRETVECSVSLVELDLEKGIPYRIRIDAYPFQTKEFEYEAQTP